MSGDVLTALAAFAPVTPAEWILLLLTAIATIIALTYITRVYNTNLLVVWLTALCISWIPVQVLALAGEGRAMWLPGQHSAVFFWGDSILLPLVAIAVALMRRAWREQNPTGKPLADNTKWRLSVIVVAILVAAIYHYTQVRTWSAPELHAPSKLWHDYAVYPVFLYFLASQAPFIWQVNWNKRRRLQVATYTLACLGVAGWWYLGHVYDPSQVDSHQPLLVWASGQVETHQVPLYGTRL